MNKDTFLRAITHPINITGQDLEALEEVVENFPYCQLAHILVAKATYDGSGMLVPQKVRKAAAYAISRDALKKLLVDRDEAKKDPTSDHPSVPAPPESTGALAAVPASEPEVPSLAFDAPSSLEDDLLNGLENTAPVPGASSPDEEKNLEKVRQLQIIENFIRTQPRIPTMRADENTLPDRDLAEKSASLNSKVISESLAKIMVKQGKIEKAIEIYQELINKHPDKKTYFAEKIDALNAKN